MRMPLLFVDEGRVYNATLLNISEEGLYITDFPHSPTINLIPVMIALLIYPDFSKLPDKLLFNLQKKDLSIEVLRLRATIVRTTKGLSEGAGCKLVMPSEASKLIINQYVSLVARNLVYFLSLFEVGSRSENETLVIRKIAEIFDYKSSLPISELRAKALHDYQSLDGA